MKTLPPDRLQVGSLYFVANVRLLVDSLFAEGGTAGGTFKRYTNRVIFHRGNGEPFAALIANPGQSRFFVSCSRSEPDGGRIRYMFGLSERDAQSLGISALRYSAQSDEADRVWEAVNTQPVPA